MIRTALHSLALLVTTVLWSGAAVAGEDVLTARGNEPSWRLSLSSGAMAFEAPGQELKFEAPIQSRDIVDGRPRIIAGAGAETLKVTILERMCADTMTGMPFPVGVEVEFGGRRFEGCGGDIMTAIEGGWRVIRMQNAPLAEGVIVTVVFGPEGQVSGRSGCNRFTGSYELSGEGLSFGRLAVTRMACPPPHMETEQRFHDLLQKITRVTPGGNGQLRLMAGDEQAMVLDRAD